MRIHALDQDAAEDVAPSVVGGDGNAGLLRFGGEPGTIALAVLRQIRDTLQATS